MKLEELLNAPGEWLKGSGPEHDIVISSRIRLARNFSGFQFSNRLENNRRENLIRDVETAVEKCAMFKQRLFLRNDRLETVDNELLLERHLISREHALDKRARAVCITPNEILSLMVLEEDHLRIQTIQSGFNLVDVWRLIDKLDSDLEKHLSYAFHPEFGYLTACPTNVGTGIRVSSMLHLPALVMTKQLNRVLTALQKLNLVARGMYGEGTQATGNFFQISNQVTLGQTETDVIESLESDIRQIIEHEREARTQLLEKKRLHLEDQVWRAIGVLKGARMISSADTMSLLSMTRLGMDLNLVQGIHTKMLNELFLLIQPAHMQRLSKRTLSAKERDQRRAELVRFHLKPVELN